MNFLPPPSPVKKYFGLWLSLILIFLAAGSAGVVYIKIRLDQKTTALEKVVKEDRSQWHQIQSNKRQEQEFNTKFGAELEQQKVTQRLSNEQMPWKISIEQMMSTLPNGVHLFHLQGNNHRLDGWGAFSSVKEATDFINQMTEKDHQIEKGWIDCIGSKCSDTPIPKEAANKTIVHFHFTYIIETNR